MRELASTSYRMALMLPALTELSLGTSQATAADAYGVEYKEMRPVVGHSFSSTAL